MKVVDITDNHEANNVQELETILTRRCENDFNSFWLSHNDGEYPTLSILVKGELATLTFMPREFEAGYSSVGKSLGLKAGATTTFSISNNCADDVVVSKNAVVPFSTALHAAKEFFHSKSLPQSIEWLQL